MSRKQGPGPLLYLHQPFARTPANHSMQEMYSSKQEQEPIDEMTQGKLPSAIAGEMQQSRKPASPEITDKEKYQQEAAVLKAKSKPAFTKVKPFKEMEVREKIEYLLNLPSVLAPIACVFYTLDGKYQGFVIGEEANQLTIKTAGETTHIVPISDITNIVMIGIRK